MNELTNNQNSNNDEIDWERLNDIFSLPDVEQISVMSAEKAAEAEALRDQMLAENSDRESKDENDSEEMIEVFGPYDISDDEDDEDIVVGFHHIPAPKKNTLNSDDVLAVEFSINHTRTLREGVDLIEEWSSYAIDPTEAREQREKLTRWLERGKELRHAYHLIVTPHCNATVEPLELTNAIATAIQSCGHVATNPRHRRIGLELRGSNPDFDE